MARRPRKVSRRKAQGSGFKGSGFRLFKVQSAVLAAQGLGFGVWGLGLKVQGSGFKGSGFRLRFRPQGSGQAQVVGAGARLRVPGFKLRPTKPANGRFMKPSSP